MERSSRLSGFYRHTPAERLRSVAEWAGLGAAEVDALTASLPLEVADHLVENVIGIYALPLGIAVNFVVNGRDVLIPMVVEEPSVIAGVSNAARMVRDGGGFVAGADAPEMIAQVQLLDVPDLDAAQDAIESAREEILGEVEATSSTIVRRGGGARGLEVRCFAATPAGPRRIRAKCPPHRPAVQVTKRRRKKTDCQVAADETLHRRLWGVFYTQSQSWNLPLARITFCW